jgi:hypothetical protein
MSHPVYGDHWSRRYVRSAVMLSAAASHSGVELRDNRGINKRDIEVDDSEGEDNANDSDGDAESLHPFRYGHGRTVVTADLDDLDLESGDGHGGATSATRGENTDVAADEGEDVDVDAPAAAVGAEEGAETDPDRDPTTRPAVPDTPRKLGWMRRSMANLGSRKRESGVGAALERHNSNNSIAPLQRLERQNSTGTIDEPERPKSRRLLQRPRLPAPSAYSYSLRTALPRPPVTRSMSSDTATSASRAPPAPVPPCATPPRAASSLGVGLRGMDMAMGSGGAPVSSVPLSRSPTGGSDFEGPYRRNRSSKSTNNLADMLRLERDKERAEKPEKGRAERAPTERAERTSVATVASRPLEFLSVLRAQSIYRGRSVTPEPARVATPEPLEPAEPSSPIDPEPLTPGPLHDEPVYLELADADPYEEDPTTPREGAVSGITWFEPVPRRGAVGSRRTARGVDGRAVRSVYTPGWERRVLDLDARLHEAVSALAGGQPSFATGLDLELKSGDGSANGGSRRVPQTVLDLGCGTGAWAVAQAQAWPSAKFVCADLVPAQIDLEALAAGEERLSEGKGEGLWRSVVDRIKFEHYDL